MKKRLLWILTCLLLICFGAVLCGCGEEDYSLPEGRDENGTVRFIYNDEVLGEVSLAQIKELPSKTKRLQYSSTQFGQVNADFTGAQLADVIRLLDEKILDEYDSLTPFGSDGYFSKVQMDEARQLNNVFIMYLQDGESMPIYKGDAEGSMRLIVTNDQFGIRFTNYLVDIILDKEED